MNGKVPLPLPPGEGLARLFLPLPPGEGRGEGSANGLPRFLTRRRAFTLVEVLLVLAILAVVSAIAWPALQRPFANMRLHSAADAVRSEWCQARVDAMRSGHTYAFRYEVGGEHFRLAPDGVAPAAPAGAADPPAAAAQDDCPEATEDASTGQEGKSLPEGIKFMAGEVTSDAASVAAESETESSPEAGDCWSDPIFFYPDGTTSDAHVTLANDRRAAIGLLLRGITGTVTVGDVAMLVE